MPYTFLSHLLVRYLLTHHLLDYALTLFYNHIIKSSKKKKNHFLGLLSSPSGLKTSGPGVTRINE